MKKNLMKLISAGVTGCIALSFQVISTQPNRGLAFDASPIAAERLTVSGSAAFKHDLYLGEDPKDPKEPTAEDHQLLTFYGE